MPEGILPVLWMLKATAASGAASGVAVAGWYEMMRLCGSAPTRTVARKMRRENLRESQPGKGNQGSDSESGGAEDDEESSESDDEEHAITTNVVQGVLVGGAVGFAASVPLSIPLLHLRTLHAAVSGALAGCFMLPVWITWGGMGVRHIGRNLPSYASRLVLLSGTAVLILGPAVSIWTKFVLKLHAIKKLEGVGVAALHKTGAKKVTQKVGKHVSKLGHQVVTLATKGKVHRSRDYNLLIVSAVRLVVYGHAAPFMWHFANRYPDVQRAKVVREGTTRDSMWLNDLSIFLTQVVGNLVAGCWFAAAMLDTPGKIASDWLMLWPPYIWSYTILVHLQTPSDDHDTSRGIAMWRMAWFGVACCSVLPTFSNVHVQAVESFLSTVGYAAWLGTFNGEWQRLRAPENPTLPPTFVLVNPERYLELRRERRKKKGAPEGEVIREQAWKLPDGAVCAKTGRALGEGDSMADQVCFLRTHDHKPVRFDAVDTVPTVSHFIAQMRRTPLVQRHLKTTVGQLRNLQLLDTHEPRFMSAPSSPRGLLAGAEGEQRVVILAAGVRVRGRQDLDAVLNGKDDDETIEVVLGHCTLDPEAAHPALLAQMRRSLHMLAAAAGYPATWNDKKGCYTYERPYWRALRVQGDAGGIC
eukprot:Hpha_TRINITY_DN7586_c0_g1::TRINITY_DN7586_c0_g1_i1::g.18779::m.18779